jgi:hypothetical protein
MAKVIVAGREFSILQPGNSYGLCLVPLNKVCTMSDVLINEPLRRLP